MNSNNKLTKMIIGGLVALVALVIGGAIAISQNAKKSPVTQQPKVTKVDKVAPKKSDKDEFSQQGALDAMSRMLKEWYKAPIKDATLETRMKATEKDYQPNDIITSNGWKNIHFSSFLADDSRGKTLTAQAILTALKVIEASGNKDMVPAKTDLSQVILLDKDVKVANIPLDLYSNTSTNIAFELFYMDGKWKLQPYSLITQISIKATAIDQSRETNEKDKAVNDKSELTKKEETKIVEKTLGEIQKKKEIEAKEKAKEKTEKQDSNNKEDEKETDK